MIGCNLPDVDAILYAVGSSDFSLWFRRGWTHGVLALAFWPFVLTGTLLLWARLRGGEPPDTRRLFAISTFAILTHPALDWLNNYGMRWLMPFRGTWFYGDAVFIADLWLWIVLLAGWLLGRGANKRGTRAWAVPALVIAVAYIGGRLLIHEATERVVRRELRPVRMMASPRPIDPTTWDIVAQLDDHYRYGRYTWADRKLTLAADRLPLPADTPEWRAAKSDPSVRGFMNWVRFPWYYVEKSGGVTRVHIMDARYAQRRMQGFGGVVVEIR